MLHWYTALPSLQSERNDLRARVEEVEEECRRRNTDLTVKREALQEEATTRRAAFETQVALRKEEAAELSDRLSAACATRNDRYQALQQLHKALGKNNDLINARL